MTRKRKMDLVIACIAASQLNEKDKNELIGFMKGFCEDGQEEK